MKEVQFEGSSYLNDYTEFDLEGLETLVQAIKDKMQRAVNSRLTEVFVQFRSTLEPYEDCSAGPVEVQVRGKRGLNKLEQYEEKRQESIAKLASELGVTFYEASVIQNLKSRGKI